MLSLNFNKLTAKQKAVFNSSLYEQVKVWQQRDKRLSVRALKLFKAFSIFGPGSERWVRLFRERSGILKKIQRFAKNDLDKEIIRLNLKLDEIGIKSVRVYREVSKRDSEMRNFVKKYMFNKSFNNAKGFFVGFNEKMASVENFTDILEEKTVCQREIDRLIEQRAFLGDGKKKQKRRLLSKKEKEHIQESILIDILTIAIRNVPVTTPAAVGFISIKRIIGRIRKKKTPEEKAREIAKKLVWGMRGASITSGFLGVSITKTRDLMKLILSELENNVIKKTMEAG